MIIQAVDVGFYLVADDSMGDGPRLIGPFRSNEEADGFKRQIRRMSDTADLMWWIDSPPVVKPEKFRERVEDELLEAFGTLQRRSNDGR